MPTNAQENTLIHTLCKDFLHDQKMYLWTPDGPENLINRKNIFFYIEAIPNNFSQLRKKIFFFAIENFFEKKSKKKSEKKIEKSETKNPRFFKISNFEILKFEILKKSRGFFEIFSRIFFRHFF